MALRRDTYGVPILNSEEVEQLAERFLSKVAPDCLTSPRMTPLAGILALLQDHELLTVTIADLGSDSAGHKYLGWYNTRDRAIHVDISLTNGDPRYSFTVAHELGHFYLHSPVKAQALYPDSGTIRDTTRHLVLRRVESSRPRSVVEWQANAFASAILLPRATIHQAVTKSQAAIGLARDRGTVWLDHQPSSRRDYQAIIGRLAEVYQTSRSVVRIRLEHLGVIRERVGPGMTSIKDVIGSVLTSIARGDT